MYENETREIVELQKQWLAASKMTKQQLLMYRIVSDFKPTYIVQDDYGIIKLQYKKNKENVQIGKNIVYCIHDKESKLNALLLVLSIAQVLDSANENVPAFNRREDRYFYKKVKKFIYEMGRDVFL